jgi:hypothetical protein
MNPKHPPDDLMTLGNMRALGVKLGLIAALFRGRYGRKVQPIAMPGSSSFGIFFLSRSQRSRAEAAYATHVVTQNSLELGFPP